MGKYFVGRQVATLQYVIVPYVITLQCKEGDQVKIRLGGDFFYPPEPPVCAHSLLLVAGGVGINPLASILHYVAECKDRQEQSPEKVQLLYSAKTTQELIYKVTPSSRGPQGTWIILTF